jgi:hypothetical protein
MNQMKLAAAFAIALVTAPMAATAQEDNTQNFDPTTTGTIIAAGANGFNMRASETYPNIHSCLEQADAEISDFREMRHNDIISHEERFTLICEDSYERVEITMSRDLGVRHSVTFK